MEKERFIFTFAFANILVVYASAQLQNSTNTTAIFITDSKYNRRVPLGITLASYKVNETIRHFVAHVQEKGIGQQIDMREGDQILSLTWFALVNKDLGYVSKAFANIDVFENISTVILRECVNQRCGMVDDGSYFAVIDWTVFRTSNSAGVPNVTVDDKEQPSTSVASGVTAAALKQLGGYADALLEGELPHSDEDFSYSAQSAPTIYYSFIGNLVHQWSSKCAFIRTTMSPDCYMLMDDTGAVSTAELEDNNCDYIFRITRFIDLGACWSGVDNYCYFDVISHNCHQRMLLWDMPPTDSYISSTGFVPILTNPVSSRKFIIRLHDVANQTEQLCYESLTYTDLWINPDNMAICSSIVGTSPNPSGICGPNWLLEVDYDIDCPCNKDNAGKQVSVFLVVITVFITFSFMI